MASASLLASPASAIRAVAQSAKARPNGGISVERMGLRAVEVNRIGKGDLRATRLPAAKPDSDIPASGAVWQLKDVFSAYGDEALPKVAFAPRSLSGQAELLVAYSHFSRQDAGPGDTSGILTARAALPRKRGGPRGFDVTPASADAVLAYAPADGGHDAPFDALMNGPGPRIAALPGMPRARPGETAVSSWLAGRTIYQFGPGQHEWAANPLPQAVFGAKEQKCLAEAVYFEARGEPETGQAAVAQVVLNRVRNPAYPSSICGVVYQNLTRGRGCQFSFACDGIPERVTSQRAWKTAQRIAREVTDGSTWVKDVGDSTHYHANYVRPRWARAMKKVDRIGDHIFYRTRFGGWS